MADIPLGTINGDSGGQIELAPDLTWPSDKKADTAGIKEITGIDASSGLTTALSLTGKHVIRLLRFNDLTTEQITLKLTVDSVVIWEDTFTLTATGLFLFGWEEGGSGETTIEDMICNSSFLLEIQTATDNNISFRYSARPIL